MSAPATLNGDYGAAAVSFVGREYSPSCLRRSRPLPVSRGSVLTFPKADIQ